MSSCLIAVNLQTTVLDEKSQTPPGWTKDSDRGRWWAAKLTVVHQEDAEGREYEGAPFESWGETQEDALEQLAKKLERALAEVRAVQGELKGGE